MQTLNDIKALLAEHGLEPKKSLGQNFLIDGNLVRKIVTESGVRHGSVVLEVGPGTGVLTEALLAHGCRVVACELDDALAAILAERAAGGGIAGGDMAGGDRLTVVHGDCLAPDRTLSAPLLAALNAAKGGAAAPYAMVANLPYGAATPLISTLLLRHPACTAIAVTVQREVADRLLADPGTKEYGGLSVIAQAMAEVRKIANLPRECFWPRPDVVSAMVVLERRPQPLTADPAGLSAFCRVLFAHRRKQLGGILGKTVQWPHGIDPTYRPERLSVEEIEELRLAVGRPPPGEDEDDAGDE